MLLDYELFKFHSAPETGNDWFQDACRLAGLDTGRRVDGPAETHETRDNVLTVTLVREPTAWLSSYFEYIHPHPLNIPEIDRLIHNAQQLDFNRFIRNYLDQCPGQVLKIFQAFPAETALKIEDQPWALMEFMKTVGEIPDVMIERLRDLEVVDNGPRIHDLKKDLRQAVRVAEREVIETYEY